MGLYKAPVLNLRPDRFFLLLIGLQCSGAPLTLSLLTPYDCRLQVKLYLGTLMAKCTKAGILHNPKTGNQKGPIEGYRLQKPE